MSMQDADAKFSDWWNERIENVTVPSYGRDFSMRDAFRAGWEARANDVRKDQLAALRKLCAEAAEYLANKEPRGDFVSLYNRLRAAAKEEA